MKRYSHDSNPDIPSWDALKQCFDEELGTFMGKVTVDQRTYDLDGTGYSGYQAVTWEEIERRKPIVGWFSGFVVTWTDVIIDYTKNPEGNNKRFTYPGNKIPMHIFSPAERERIDGFFEWDRKFTGTRNEVRAFCAK